MIAIVNGGIIQVDGGTFSANMYGFDGTGKNGYHKWVNSFVPGLPHGYGDSVDLARRRAVSDAFFRREILQDPKVALVNILKSETITRPAEVEPPYTILLLRKDGYVVDYSDNTMCTIPADAQLPTQKTSAK